MGYQIAVLSLVGISICLQAITIVLYYRRSIPMYTPNRHTNQYPSDLPQKVVSDRIRGDKKRKPKIFTDKQIWQNYGDKRRNDTRVHDTNYYD